ncbi:hypothetical protein GIB67_029020 [Kingdonia uniflora]|uniref:Uncharacterized protein n=1 Tax=Kingdonia uniflora TaxID=39325 RepID=A0A7J7N6C3_9MAGN|nr:hypothetical protein GIB67_029020 [Kingdonia uniflora]
MARSQRIHLAIEGRLAIKTAVVHERIFGSFGYDAELLGRECDRRLKRENYYGSRRWLYNNVVREKLDATADSYSDTEGFPGQLLSYPPGSNAFREFCKAKAAVGGKWGNYVEFVGRQFRGYMVAEGEKYFYLEVEKRDRGIDESISLEYFDDEGDYEYNWGMSCSIEQEYVGGVKSNVERKESLLDKVAEEETKLKLVLKGLSLSRKKMVDSRSNKVQSTRSMTSVDEGKRQLSGKEAQNNFSKTLGTGSSAQSNPVKPNKVALEYPKKWMLKALPASGTSGSGEVVKDKRRRVEPFGESGEKVEEGRSAMVDDLKEVEEWTRLVVLYGEEDASKMVAHLAKGIWLGIEEEKIRQLRASHAVAIGQLEVETMANFDEMVEECDRLRHYLMLKGYFEDEVDAIKADTYAEEEDEEEAEAVGIVDDLDGISR